MEKLLAALTVQDGGAVVFAFQIAFLACFGIAVLGLLFIRRGGASGFRFSGLGLLYTVGFAALFLYQACWQMTGFQSELFLRFVNDYNTRPSSSRSQITRGVILDRKGRILAASLPGQRRERQTALGEAGFHPLGYSHPRYGLAGVERVMDPILNGLSMPAAAGERPQDTMRRMLLARPSPEGGTVQLTLDLDLQRTAYDALKGRKGAVVVMDPRNGEILALVSVPGVDMAVLPKAMGDTVNAPLVNRAVNGLYPPGSTFKIVMAALASETGKMPLLDTPGSGYVAAPATPPIRDSEFYAAQRKGHVWNGWGRIDLPTAFLHSSNVYFARLGAEYLTLDDVRGVADRLHLGERIPFLACRGRELAASPGVLPDLTRNRKALSQTAIGQGELALTPLHVALYTAAIAANGQLFAPHLLMNETPESMRVWRPETARAVTSMMRRAVSEGTGRQADIRGLEVCGKTGTAQTGGQNDHAWFTCFAPRNNPRVVVTVLIEEGGFGAAAALPVAKTVLLKARDLRYFSAQ